MISGVLTTLAPAISDLEGVTPEFMQNLIKIVLRADPLAAGSVLTLMLWFLMTQPLSLHPSLGSCPLTLPMIGPLVAATDLRHTAATPLGLGW